MTRLDADARGVFIIAATPFAEDGRLDLEATDRLIDWYLGHGVAGITILGIMGEAPKLTGAEASSFARRVLARVAARVPVVVGVSSPGYAGLLDLTREVMAVGAAGVMIAPPSSLRGDEAVLGYCRDVAERLGENVPWVLQDYPLVGGPPMSPTLIRRIADTCPNLAVLKHEDWPGLDKISALRAQETAGAPRLSILCGNGGLFLPFELQRGADGAMTGFAYPEMLVGVCRLIEDERKEDAMDLYDAHLPLIRYEHQPGLGLAVRKHILWRRGALASPALRAPAPRLSAETRAEVDWLMARLETRRPS